MHSETHREQLCPQLSNMLFWNSLQHGKPGTAGLRGPEEGAPQFLPFSLNHPLLAAAWPEKPLL